jgi:Tol biopolymer transport system component
MIDSFDSGQITKTGDPIAPFDGTTLDIGTRWSPDGRSVLYLNSRDGTNNLVSQPIDGGAPKRLTNFRENGIGFFAFSHDGKKIAFVRSATRSDVVLIRDFK